MLYQKRSVCLRQLIQIDRNAVFSDESARVDGQTSWRRRGLTQIFPFARPTRCLAFDADSLFLFVPVNSKLIEKVAMPNHRR
jgi:hypothetical protein